MKTKNKTDFFSSDNAMLLFHFFFFMGLSGIVFKRHVFLLTLLSIEIMYLAIICLTALSTNIVPNAHGQVFALAFLVIAACESAIGLGILIVSYRFGKSLSFADYEELKG